MQMNDIVTISGWIVAVLLGIPAAVYYGRRVLKERASGKAENMQRMREILMLVIQARDDAEYFHTHEFAGYSLAWFDMRPWLKKGTRKRLLRLQRLAKDFELWLNLAEDLAYATMFKAAYYDGTFSEFSQKMDHTGRGHFHDLLYSHFRLPVLSGQHLTPAWVRDNCSDFYSELMATGSQKDLKKVLEPIQEVVENECLKIMREKREEFLKEAHQVEEHLKQLSGEQ